MDATTHPDDPLRRTLELTVLSLEELREDRKHTARSLYVVVRAESINCYATGTAAEGCGGKPSWNEKLVVDVPVHARSITLEVKRKNAPGVKDVGVARIAVSDFLGGAVPDERLRFLSYRLRDWQGRRSGVLNFSVRARTPEKVCSCSGDVVIGVPVWWYNRDGMQQCLKKEQD
ncbi:BON1-associated protein 2 [Spatholobus suberectus]|nr:BON1-associated protein 2 [Spatholobus suberectus]TKY65547.1 BON1-associated protein 2 [Spatholobus suberectus]